MAPSQERLLDALELGGLGVPMSPGRTWRVELPGVFVRDSAIASPRANQVTLARLDADDADATIARVRAHFGARPFGWNVGPRSTPADLVQRLERAGLRELHASVGLVLSDLAQPIAAPSFAMRRATPADAERLAAIGVSMFGHRPDEARWLQELGLSQPALQVWLAEEDGELLGFGQSHVTADGIALLVGAATLPHARGRGVYRALLRHRISLAYAEGATTAIIQAHEQTSAPICKRVGFVQACRLHYLVATSA